MSDQREPFRRRPKSVDQQIAKMEHGEAGGESSSRSDQTPGAQAETIKMVSDLIAIRKESLAVPPARPQFPLTDLSGSLGELGRRLRNPLDVQARIDPARTFVEAPSIKLPEPGPAERPAGDENPAVPFSTSTQSGSQTPISKETGSESSTKNPISSISSFNGSPTPETGKKTSENPDSLREGDALGVSPSLAVSHPIERGVIGNPHPVDGPEASKSNSIGPVGSILVEIAGRGGHPSETVAVPAHHGLERFRDFLVPTRGADARRAAERENSIPGPSIARVNPSGSIHSIDPAIALVQNPLSADLKNFGMTGSAESGSSGMDSSGGGLGPPEASGGLSDSGMDSGSLDLSRTNDLLQQLVDAVRKERGSLLPAGGPSVYPDR